MTTNTTTTDLKSPAEEQTKQTEAPHRHTVPPPEHKPRKRGIVWVLLLLLVGGVAAYAVWKAGQPGLIPANPNAGGRGRGRGGAGAFGPTPVVIAKAKQSNVPVYLTGLGNVSAFYTVTVKSRVDGQLMSVAFKEGDYVKEGQLLAQIDPRPYQVQLEQAEGALAHDQALLTNAQLDLTRYRTLLAQDAIPKQQLDTQVATVGQYQGNIKTDQANIDNAKLQLVYAKVTAPISGRIGLRLVDPGNIVHASDANGLLVITQLQPISVLFTIPEDSLPQVMTKLRAGVRLTADAFNRDNSSKIASGYLLTVDNTIDQTTGTSKMKAVFDNKDNALFPNQFVNVRLLVDTKHNQVVVPSVAIQHGQQGPFVFLVGSDSKVKMQNVTPDIVLDDNTTSISSGLAAGDSVVIDGTDRLQNGSPVRERKPGDDGSGAGGGRGRGGRGHNAANKKGSGAAPGSGPARIPQGGAGGPAPAGGGRGGSTK
jgi:multidrug efflux system membrane fusion protein